MEKRYQPIEVCALSQFSDKAHVRRYWLKADSKNGRIGVDYCDRLFHIKRKIKHLSPEERVQVRQQESKPIGHKNRLFSVSEAGAKSV